MKILLCSLLTRFSKGHSFQEITLLRPFVHLAKSNVLMIGMEHCWDGTVMWKPKYWEKNIPRCYFVYYKSHRLTWNWTRVFKDEINLNHMWRFISYRAVNTLHFILKNRQSVCGNKYCFVLSCIKIPWNALFEQTVELPNFLNPTMHKVTTRLRGLKSMPNSGKYWFNLVTLKSQGNSPVYSTLRFTGSP